MRAKDTGAGHSQSISEKRKNRGLKAQKEDPEKDAPKALPSRRKKPHHGPEQKEWLSRLNKITTKLSTSNDLTAIQKLNRDLKKFEQLLEKMIKEKKQTQKTKEQITFENEAIQKLQLLKEGNNKLILGYFDTLKSRFQNSLETFENDSKWEESPNLMPSYIRDESMNVFSSQVKQAKALLDEDSYQCLANLYDRLKNSNSKRARKALSRRQLKPDNYNNDDSSQIKKQAKTTVLKAYPSAIVQRIHITDQEWKETKNSKPGTDPSLIVKRREIMVQLAAELNNRSRLFTIYLHQEKKINGNWNQIKGRILFSDPIMKKNINSPFRKES